jgi:DNA mismatch repair protein MutS
MTDKSTPLIKQYLKIKEQYPERILFFRMGDFYEMFGDDAKIAAEVLGITLTSRNHGKSGKIPLAGVPYHQAEKYLAGLLKAGYGVAVCEQVEDPKLAKGLVKRDVIEVLTPGSVTVEGVLDDGAASFIASLAAEDNTIGIALLDYTTGEFILDEIEPSRLELTLNRYQPSELLLPDTEPAVASEFLRRNNIPIWHTEDFRFETEFAREMLNNHFGTVSLDGFGVSDMPLAIGAAGALLDYIKKLKKGQADHIRVMVRASSSKDMYLDPATVANLELLESSSGGREYSLLWLLSKCRTPMGKRVLRRRIVAPLIDRDAIKRRQARVLEFYNDRTFNDDIVDILKDIKDIERILSRFVAGRATPRDLLALRESFEAIAKLKNRLNLQKNALNDLGSRLDEFADIHPELQRALVDNPPVSYLEGGIFRKGYSARLDEMRGSIADARAYIKNLQAKERERTGIPTLKVGFNKVFGYYIEISKGQASKASKEYIRKQTLVNAERFITEEMKEKEELILKAEEKINLLEAELFIELKGKIKELSPRILKTSKAIAGIDYFQSLATVARLNGYTIPRIVDVEDDSDMAGTIEIKGGRHPMVEKSLPPGEFR